VSIVLWRKDIKAKKEEIKALTFKINMRKKEIDAIQAQLDKKEDERKMGGKRNEFQHFDEEEAEGETIIDEEELKLLKELKDGKRDYRDNYSKLKALKEDLLNVQANIDTTKEMLIIKFENWYQKEFDLMGPNNGSTEEVL
jgi:predicted  nucleic acid-binding Zn-ribbon protein